MKITLTGSLGNVSKPLAEQLIRAGHQVTVITSNPERKNAIIQLGAIPAIGLISDTDFLTSAFTGADAVYTMTPTDISDPNLISSTINAGKCYAEAIRAAGVKRVVMLSSMGADQTEGTGPVKGIHQIEELFKQLDGVDITFLRAGFFYYNYFRDLPTIRQLNIMGSNYPGTTKLPMVHPRDIATAAAKELQSKEEGKKVKYIVSDILSPGEVAPLLGAAIGKPDLKWVEFTDKQVYDTLVEIGLPKEIAEGYVEMGEAFGSGHLAQDFFASGAPICGKTKFAEFVKEFAEKFYDE